eukprot:symbB.v1.2.018209.t1/scaffold1443.1/size118444/5
MRFRQVDNVTRNASELDELLANETYLVKVFAWNGIGRSLDGVHRTFHTLDATVPGSVDDLSVSRRQMEGCFRSF